MAIDPANKHVNALIDNVHEVDRLRKFRAPLRRKRKTEDLNLEVLYKSCIVLLVACWEAYVEDLAVASLELMVENAGSHTIIPKPVLERVSSIYTGPKAWELAGEGWKVALRDNLKAVLARTTGALNTPKTAQVNELFHKTIGLSALSSNWQWDGTTSGEAEAALDALVSLRGSIAHRVVASKSVTSEDVSHARDLIYRLAAKCHNTVGAFLKAQLGSVPWKRITYRESPP